MNNLIEKNENKDIQIILDKNRGDQLDKNNLNKSVDFKQIKLIEKDEENNPVKIDIVNFNLNSDLNDFNNEKKEDNKNIEINKNSTKDNMINKININQNNKNSNNIILNENNGKNFINNNLDLIDYELEDDINLDDNKIKEDDNNNHKIIILKKVILKKKVLLKKKKKKFWK